MCGRYSGGWSAEAFEKLFNVQPALFDNFNVAPTQVAPVIFGASARETLEARWGLIPAWVRDPLEVKGNLFNARAETLNERASFKGPHGTGQRCLVPALGFYEWQKRGNTKRPHFIKREDGDLLAFAGLYERWEKSGVELYSFSIVTTSPNDLMAGIHDRMPVVLEREDCDLWLRGEVDEVEKLLRPFAGELEAYPVDKRVGNVKENDKGLLEPVKNK